MTHKTGMFRGGKPVVSKNYSDTWLTPRELIDILGPFQTDPCVPDTMPWKTANRMITKAEDGLESKWYGRVWLNPPYGIETGKWLDKLAEHGDGIALVFARSDTQWFHRQLDSADCLYIFQGRLGFAREDGVSPGKANAPSVLFGYGKTSLQSMDKLPQAGYPGRLIHLRGQQYIA